ARDRRRRLAEGPPGPGRGDPAGAGRPGGAHPRGGRVHPLRPAPGRRRPHPLRLRRALGVQAAPRGPPGQPAHRRPARADRRALLGGPGHRDLRRAARWRAAQGRAGGGRGEL
ncbi:MAG: hypothetical protein AVDCRST_MAG13-1043, partial [uncultured Solirubrobacteraceae bacterium]